MQSLKHMHLAITLAIAILFLFVSVENSIAADSNLSGYAWSENTGWINFSPTGGGVSVNGSGDLYGYAWGENIGWVSFNCVNTSSCSVSDYKVSMNPFPYQSGGGGGGGGCQICPSCESSKTDTVAPKISKAEVVKISSSSATVSWETDESADSMAQYGLEGIYAYMAGNPADISNPKKKHEVILIDLFPEKNYNLKVVSRDTAGNVSISDNISFKTLALSEEEKMEDRGKLDLTKKMLDELYAKGIIDDQMLREIIEKTVSKPFIFGEETSLERLTSRSVVILWKTDKKTNSFVRFKKKNENDSQWKEIGITSDFDVNHIVKIDNLESGTAYEYQAKSMDVLGNAALSKINNFTTKDKIAVSEVAVSDITLESAVISWKTNIPITSEVDYGFSADYNLKHKGGTEDRVMAHNVKITDLESGKIYHFKVTGRGDGGDVAVSDDYVFSTYATPVISNYSLKEIRDYKASIKWLSNVETDSTVVITNVKTTESRTEGDIKLVRDHQIDLKNLEPGTEYVVSLEGRDIFGNIAKSPNIKIVTLLDNIPPKIDNVRMEVGTSSNSKNRAQLVIFWKTDEPASSQVVLYESGIKEKPSNISTYDSNLTTKHTAVFMNLNPGTVYRFQAESADKAGNLIKSKDFVALTPQVHKSILQIIIESLEKLFGWVKKIVV